MSDKAPIKGALKNDKNPWKQEKERGTMYTTNSTQDVCGLKDIILQYGQGNNTVWLIELANVDITNLYSHHDAIHEEGMSRKKSKKILEMKTKLLICNFEDARASI